MIQAVETLEANGCYVSPEIAYHMNETLFLEVEEYDLMLLRDLSLGYSQREISARFRQQDISPNSLSSIEKRINLLKDYFRARNIPHLIALVKDEALI